MSAYATIDYSLYEGLNNIQEGQGGTRISVKGMGFWTSGAHPKKYVILGMVVSEAGSGAGDESRIRSAVAGEVQKRGGDAAIQVNENDPIPGMVQISPGFYMTTGVKKMQFAIIKYVK